MDLTNVKEIQIHYENCEVCAVPAKLVTHIKTENEKKEYDKHSFPNRLIRVSSLEIVLDEKSDEEVYMHFEEGRKPFERTLQRRDIVYVMLLFQDGKKEKIVAPWKGDYYDDNPNQTSSVLKNGQLKIEIAS